MDPPSALLGLRIGDASLELLEFAPGGGVRSAVVAELPTGAVMDGDPIDDAVIAEAILAAGREAGCATRHVILALDRTVMGFVRLAGVAHQTFEAAPGRFLESHLIFDLADVQLDWEARPDGDDLLVAYAAIKLQVVEAWLGPLQGAGLELERVRATPLSLARAWGRSGTGGTKGIAALLDVGHDSTTMLTFDGPNLVDCYYRPGTIAAADTLHKELGVTPAEADAWVRPDADPPQSVREILRASWGELARYEFERMLGARGVAQGRSPSRVCFSGSGSLAPLFLDAMRGSLPWPVERFDPLAALPAAPGAASLLARRGPAFAATAGLLPIQGIGAPAAG